MDILILAQYCGSFSPADNDRFFDLARLLAKEHEVEIVTSSFRHEVKRQRNREELPEGGVKITAPFEPGYPRNVCLGRFKSDYIWGRNVLRYLKQRKKPDVVYCAVPSLAGPLKAAKFCERNGIRFIVDVQDLWPEAFRMALDIPGISGLLFAPFMGMADGIYRRADAVCGVSEEYCKRALRVNRKGAKGTAVYLGTALEVFDRSAEKNAAEKRSGETWLGYVGTLGTSYDLPVVFEALRKIDYPGLKFIVMGDGPLADDFKKQAEGLPAVFTGRIPYDRMCGILKQCDIVVNPIVGSSVATIINKHGDYAAAGKPVLNTQAGQEYRGLVEGYRMGFNCRNHDPADLAEKLEILLKDPGLRLEMGRNARRCAEEKFDRAKSYGRLQEVILQKDRDA